MIEIPIHATVTCRGGECGKSTNVIVNPITRKVTYFVVKEKGWQKAIERLVPVELVTDTTSASITLSCTMDDFNALKPFIEEHYQPFEDPTIVGAPGYALPMTVPSTMTIINTIQEKQIPAGEVTVHRGVDVQASDGYIGRVDSLLANPDSGMVTHFVLERGHLWGEKEVAIPLSAIKYYDEKTAYLKLDKETILSLPAIPARPALSEIKIASVDLLVATFTESDTAEEALKKLKMLDKRDEIEIHNAAVMVKQEDGKAVIRETGDVDRRRGGLFGALAGGLVGLAGGPIGLVVGAAIGAGLGNVSAGKIDLGFPDEFLKRIQEGLKSGNSAILVMVDKGSSKEVAAIFVELGGSVEQTTLSDKQVEQALKVIEAKQD